MKQEHYIYSTMNNPLIITHLNCSVMCWPYEKLNKIENEMSLVLMNWDIEWKKITWIVSIKFIFFLIEIVFNKCIWRFYKILIDIWIAAYRKVEYCLCIICSSYGRVSYTIVQVIKNNPIMFFQNSVYSCTPNIYQ